MSVSRPEPAKPVLRVELLDGFRLLLGDRLVSRNETVGAVRSAGEFIKLLALEPRHELSRDAIIDRLWREDRRDDGPQKLHEAVTKARSALLGDTAEGRKEVFRKGELYTLVAGGRFWSGVAIDVEEFRAAAKAAKASADLRRYEEAVARYAGDLLPADGDKRWVLIHRGELRAIFLDLLEVGARLHEGAGEYERAWEWYHQAATWPNNEAVVEEAYQGLMRLSALRGRRGKVVDLFKQLRHAAADRLGGEPGHRSQELYKALMQEDYPPPTTSRAAVLAASPELMIDGPYYELPRQLTSFIGREGAIARVCSLLNDAQLVTLTGVGGVGKTRLALAAAGHVQSHFPNGVCLVELAALTDPALLPQAIASVLGVREKKGEALTDTLERHLRDCQLLLVLDNCEHLLDACAHLAEALLRSCPKLHIIATSREKLDVPGELTYRVPSLSRPPAGARPDLAALAASEAAQLFVARARTVRPDFILAEANARIVGQVCATLEGIPLALELAAARLRTMSLAELAARLDDCFRVLTGGRRTISRHRTLEAAIDWSHALLTEEERLLLRRLSVFAGGWILEGAEAVCAGEGVDCRRVLDLLAALVEKSLVVLDEGDTSTRYRLLEPVRQYAHKQVASGENRWLRGQHARYCMRLAEEADPRARRGGGDEWQQALLRLDSESENVRAAIKWCEEAPLPEVGLRLAGGLGWYSWTRGRYDEGLAWLERAVNHRP